MTGAAHLLVADLPCFYAVYHGPQGLKQIAYRIHRMAGILVHAMQDKGLSLVNQTYFDTLTFDAGEQRDAILARAAKAEINLRLDSDGMLGVSLDETTRTAELQTLYSVMLQDLPLTSKATTQSELSMTLRIN